MMDIFKREVILRIAVITLEIQSLEASNVQRVTRIMETAIREESARGATQIIVDLGKLRYFDVSGFAAILKWTAGGKQSPEVRMCSESGTVHALFELLDANSVVRLFQSREEALESMDSHGVPPRKSASTRIRPEETNPLPGQRVVWEL